MGIVRIIVLLVFLASAGLGYGAYALTMTPVTKDNVEGRIITACRALQFGLFMQDSPEARALPLSTIDCRCVGQRIIDKHGNRFAAEMLELARQEMVPNLGRDRGLAQAKHNLRMGEAAPKLQRLAMTFITANKFCPH